MPGNKRCVTWLLVCLLLLMKFIVLGDSSTANAKRWWWDTSLWLECMQQVHQFTFLSIRCCMLECSIELMCCTYNNNILQQNLQQHFTAVLVMLASHATSSSCHHLDQDVSMWLTWARMLGCLAYTQWVKWPHRHWPWSHRHEIYQKHQ